jgi:imidazolonepropionase-like amidohydrolase
MSAQSPRTIVRAASLFDGERHHPASAGPRDIVVEAGRIVAVAPASAEATPDVTAAFVMPGLVEAHAHIFLDGGELDFAVRTEYLKADAETMVATARLNVARAAAAGVTLVRDAGDRWGINDRIRAELAGDAASVVKLRSPGLGVKRPKRYGGFMARDVGEGVDPAATIEAMVEACDDVKVILTGIIDFDAGGVKGAPQFSAEELATIVEVAHRAGKKTFAHCSGLDGLEVAVEAGIDSIEHGFFMTRSILEGMAAKGIAWVPTFSPVHFQWARPELAGWSEATIGNLRRILDGHLEHVALADRLGVNLVAGSDAGSPGVPHGTGLVDEIFHFLDAGLTMNAALTSATARPRRLWGCEAAMIAPGARAELVALAASPFDDAAALRSAPLATILGEVVARG